MEERRFRGRKTKEVKNGNKNGATGEDEDEDEEDDASTEHPR
jgi:hypothetical protein